MTPGIHASLQRGLAIPACPLALNRQRRWDERRQRALARYYFAAGSGGLAVGVHTTQFAIRDPKVGLYQPLLELLANEFTRADTRRPEPLCRIAGVCGPTPQAVAEAETARSFGYHAVLLSLGALREAPEHELIAHCRSVAEVMPVIGFYLQPAAGGRFLPYSFWRRLAELENIVAVKIAPFNRYQTIDVIRAVADSGRDDIALYTGNDDNIVLDRGTPFTFQVGDTRVGRRITGGQLVQGTTPTFKLYLGEQFGGNGMTLKLYNCVSSKLAIAVKNEDWVIPEIDFEACADKLQNVYDWSDDLL